MIGNIKPRDCQTLISNVLDKAEAFSDYFKSVYNNSPPNEDINTRSYIPHDAEQISANVMADIIVTKSEVNKLLRSIDGSKSAGPTRPLKEASAYIDAPLCRLIELSLQSGSLPYGWTLAHIVPIHKKGEKQLVQNYRHTSSTSVVCKLLEKVVCKYLKSHFSHNSILIDNQHGFMPVVPVKRSFCKLRMIGQNLWTHVSVHVIYLDISRAFDSVPHSLLLKKLNKIGISGKILPWIEVCLCYRNQQLVMISNHHMLVSSGVP